MDTFCSIDESVSVASLREFCVRFGEIDCIDVLAGKRIAFVHFCSISSALECKAVTTNITRSHLHHQKLSPEAFTRSYLHHQKLSPEAITRSHHHHQKLSPEAITRNHHHHQVLSQVPRFRSFRFNFGPDRCVEKQRKQKHCTQRKHTSEWICSLERCVRTRYCKDFGIIPFNLYF